MRKSYNFQIEELIAKLDSATGQVLVISLVVVDLALLSISLVMGVFETAAWYIVFGLSATGFYLWELVVRIYASYRLYSVWIFFSDVGNVIDTLVVFLDVFLSLVDLVSVLGLTIAGFDEIGKNAKVVRLLKLVRMARLKRLVVAAQKASHADVLEACETGNLFMLNVSLARGQDPHQRNPLKETPLHVAARGGHSKLLEALLAHHRVGQDDLQARDYVGRTPLFNACYYRHRGAVETLLMYIQDVQSALQSRPWSGPQMNISVEVSLPKFRSHIRHWQSLTRDRFLSLSLSHSPATKNRPGVDEEAPSL